MLPGIQISQTALRLVQQGGQLRGRKHLMHDPRKSCQGLAPHFTAPSGHHRGVIPAQHGLRVPDVTQLAEPRFQLLVGRHVHRSSYIRGGVRAGAISEIGRAGRAKLYSRTADAGFVP